MTEITTRSLIVAAIDRKIVVVKTFSSDAWRPWRTATWELRRYVPV